MRLGILAVARPTFDVAAATAVVDRARAALGDHELVGGSEIATGDDDVRRAATDLAGRADLDAVVLLQGTFTTSVGAAIVAGSGRPTVLWSFPEPTRETSGAGGTQPDERRLRLNSLCGATLASYTLHHLHAQVRWVHGDPDDPAVRARLADVLDGGDERPHPERPPRRSLPDEAVAAGHRAAERLRDARIGRLGDAPDGFEPCEYDADLVRARTGVVVEQLPLAALFASADAAPTPVRVSGTSTAGLDELDPAGVERSSRLLAGMRQLVADHRWTAITTRCWPECMADYGGAVCWPSAVLADAGTPAGCEADVLGTITNLALQQLSERPPFLADLVAVDPVADTGTLWHCGVAAASLARPDVPVRLAGHPNRGTPVVHDFGLAPGTITLARLSARPSGRLALVIGRGEVLGDDADLLGTSAVVRFDRPADAVLDRVLGDGLDHHLSAAYGDLVDALEALAGEWGVDVIDL